jgi:cysteine desulfurase
MNINLMTLNAHKINGPKGIGCLFIKKGTHIEAWQHGGGHEFGLRSGTENVPAIVGFGAAIKYKNTKEEIEKMTDLRNKIIKFVKNNKGNIHGPIQNRLCNNVNAYFKDVDGDALGSYLNNKGIATSLGSACSTHHKGPSHVLKAIGLKDKEASNSIRLTLSKYTTEKEINECIAILKKAIKKFNKKSFVDKIIDKI